MQAKTNYINIGDYYISETMVKIKTASESVEAVLEAHVVTSTSHRDAYADHWPKLVIKLAGNDETKLALVY